MSTPRLRSSFPNTPLKDSNATPAPSRLRHGSPASPKLRDVDTLKSADEAANAPLIPIETLDAPSQRLYVAGFYSALLFWRLYDFYHLTIDETESLWLFMKWISIDGVFLFGLPALRIPWLEWSPSVMTILFLLHALLDGVLMFRIPIPLGAGLVAVTRILYDREISVSERRVKPADILHNSSLILGKQIINILPEGSARLSSTDTKLCLDASNPSVDIILQVNQTIPTLIELLRFDLDTGLNETISLSASQAKKMRKAAEKHHKNPSLPLQMRYQTKKSGLYRLRRVLDETNLEVQRPSSDVLVVTCPKAYMKTTRLDKCVGELSDLSLIVEGTPPLRVKYRRFSAGRDHDVSFQGIQPEDLVSPLGTPYGMSALVLRDDPDTSWARTHTIKVSLNETLDSRGKWSYSVVEVMDGLNNTVNYDSNEKEFDRLRAKNLNLQHTFLVHDRPRISLDSRKVKDPLQVAQGKAVIFPIQYSSSSNNNIPDTVHALSYIFTPESKLSSDGEHCDSPETVNVTVKNTGSPLFIDMPGLYSLTSVSTPFCQGEVLEPSSSLLVNPPRPDLTIDAQPISDKCAGRPIGFSVAMDFVGTPPFYVKYKIQKRGQQGSTEDAKVFEGARGHVEIKPVTHGHYTYTFTEAGDSIYQGISLADRGLVLEQDVRPSVSARLTNIMPDSKMCIDDSAAFEVQLYGEGPWKLDYELIHKGKRTKYHVAGIEQPRHVIRTDPLQNGGQYSLALTSVTDVRECKELLQQEEKFTVRHQKSKAEFGTVDGKRAIRMLDGKKVDLPLRLSGEGPWTVTYQIPKAAEPVVKRISNPNSKISISEQGEYKLLKVRDDLCGGVVDEGTGKFDVSFIERPRAFILENGPPHTMIDESSTVVETDSRSHVRRPVCEGEGDSIEINFSGKPPFSIDWREYSAQRRAAPVGRRLTGIPQFSTQMNLNTTSAGDYRYEVTRISDQNYDDDSKSGPALEIHQTVHSRPHAAFRTPGKVYSFCHGEQAGEKDVIPIALQGAPPFSLELEVKQGKRASKPQAISIDSINSNIYNLQIPNRFLVPGISILSIRRVRDSLGCDRFPDPISSPNIQISVNEPPSISDLEELRRDYCVGEHINYALSGRAPFTVYYTFQNAQRKATVSGTTFRRIAEKPGNFTLTGVTDAASACRHPTALTKMIHEMPSVRVSNGHEKRVDIHAGGETEIHFEFGGTPPFEFTYTRSENARTGRGQGGGSRSAGRVLETRTLTSEEHSLRIRASEEGTYEVVAIKDRYCAYIREDYRSGSRGGQLLLQN